MPEPLSGTQVVHCKNFSTLRYKVASVAFAGVLKVEGVRIGATIADNKDKSKTLERNVANRARLIKGTPRCEEWNV